MIGGEGGGGGEASLQVFFCFVLFCFHLFVLYSVFCSYKLVQFASEYRVSSYLWYTGLGTLGMVVVVGGGGRRINPQVLLKNGF